MAIVQTTLMVPFVYRALACELRNPPTNCVKLRTSDPRCPLGLVSRTQIDERGSIYELKMIALHTPGSLY